MPRLHRIAATISSLPLATIAGVGFLELACAVPIAGGDDDDDAAVTPGDAGGDPDAGDHPELDAGTPSGLPAFCADYPPANLAELAQSRSVHYDDRGRLVYVADADGNRVPDFGYAGYHFGERALPDVAEVAHLGPGDGDDTGRIQAALDQVADRDPGEHGVRGALVLAPGTYEISGTLKVRAAGVVLRGAGDGDDPATSTILRATGDSPHQRSVIVVGGGGGDRWRQPLPDTQVEVTTAKVPVGSTRFEVDHPERLAVGQRVIVRHHSTAAWIAALGGGGASVAWSPGDIDILYLRRVVARDGAALTLDVPIYDHLDRALAATDVFAVDDASLVREVGLEDLRVEIVTAAGDTDENHAWNAIEVAGAEDAWVRRVTARHFGYAGVRVHDANRVTVEHARALDPVAVIDGGRRYNFAADDRAQQVLFVDCEANKARHAFISNGTSTVSGIAFVRGTVSDGYTSSEGHRRWSQALLYDSIVERGNRDTRVVGLYNRGDWGTQHGWAAVHSVVWRYDTGGKNAVVQRPPLGQNWAIGTIGPATGAGPFAGPAGAIEPITGTLAPSSLYEAQLCDRLKN